MTRIKIAHTNSSVEDNHVEAMIRCAALQAAAALVAVEFEVENNRWGWNDVSTKTKELALKFEKHLRGEE